MSIATRLVGFETVAVLSLSSCYDKNTKEALSGDRDASDEGQIEIDLNDTGIDEVENTRNDAADASAIETNNGASTNNLKKCAARTSAVGRCYRFRTLNHGVVCRIGVCLPVKLYATIAIDLTGCTLRLNIFELVNDGSAQEFASRVANE